MRVLEKMEATSKSANFAYHRPSDERFPCAPLILGNVRRDDGGDGAMAVEDVRGEGKSSVCEGIRCRRGEGACDRQRGSRVLWASGTGRDDTSSRSAQRLRDSNLIE